MAARRAQALGAASHPFHTAAPLGARGSCWAEARGPGTAARGWTWVSLEANAFAGLGDGTCSTYSSDLICIHDPDDSSV